MPMGQLKEQIPHCTQRIDSGTTQLAYRTSRRFRLGLPCDFEPVRPVISPKSSFRPVCCKDTCFDTRLQNALQKGQKGSVCCVCFAHTQHTLRHRPFFSGVNYRIQPRKSQIVPDGHDETDWLEHTRPNPRRYPPQPLLRRDARIPRQSEGLLRFGPWNFVG